MSTLEYEEKYERKRAFNLQNTNIANIPYETAVQSKISRHEEHLLEQLLSESTEKDPTGKTINETLEPFTSKYKPDQSMDQNKEKT